MKIIIAIAIFVFALIQNSSTQTVVMLELYNSSSITILGSTNISKFKLVLPGDKFPGK